MGVIALGWFRYRYAGTSFTLAATMVPVFSAYLVALTVKTFFVAILNSEHQFFAFPVASFVGTLVTLGSIAMTRGSLGVLSVPLGSLFGELVAIAILAFILFGLLRLKMKLTLERPDAVKRFAKLVGYDVAGGAVTRINPVLDQLMAGLASVVGGGTLLRLSSDVSSVPTSLVQASLLSVLLSHLSDDFAARDYTKYRQTVIRALVYVCGILVVASALLYVVREPLLRVVFLRGADGCRGRRAHGTGLPLSPPRARAVRRAAGAGARPCRDEEHVDHDRHGHLERRPERRAQRGVPAHPGPRGHRARHVVHAPRRGDRVLDPLRVEARERTRRPIA